MQSNHVMTDTNLEQSFQRLLRLGQTPEAKAIALSIIRKFPESGFGWAALGAVFHIEGQNLEASYAFEKALCLSPNDARIHNNLAIVLHALGQYEEAESSYRRAIEIQPDGPSYYYNLGNTLLATSRLSEARECYEHAILLAPDYANAHTALGVLLKDIGQPDISMTHLVRAVELSPKDASAHINLGVTQVALGLLQDAEASFCTATKHQENSADAHYNLGVVLKEQKKLAQAESSFRQAIRIRPTHSAALNNLGVLLREMGRLQASREAHEQAVVLSPESATLHRNLAMVKKFREVDSHLLQMKQMYLDTNLSKNDKLHLSFALAKAYEDLGHYEQAFTYCSNGNALGKKASKYNISEDVDLFESIKFNSHKLSNLGLSQQNFDLEITPIFVLGMPRSGTTLVEQIISSHSEVTGGGELPYVSQEGSALTFGSTKPTQEKLLAFRVGYLEKLLRHSRGNRFITDKMPQNFRFIGLISAALPEAKIVHVRRDPKAVCWSNFRHYFSDIDLRYAWSISDIKKYYRLYLDLMTFWASRARSNIYHLDYENLVSNQEDQTRRLVAHLGLKWQKQCLAPHLNGRPVATASSIQIREKIYQDSSLQWRHYEPYLRGALDDMPTVPLD